VTQGEFFKDEWLKRKHECYVCGEPLVFFSPYWMAHVLGKGAFPAFKLFSGNLVILCGDCHDLYDKKTDEAKSKPMFAELFELKEKLEILYHKVIK